MKFKTDENALIDSLKKLSSITGWNVYCKMSDNDYSVYDALIRIDNKLYCVEHKYRENITSTMLTNAPYSEGFFLEKHKHDDVMDIINQSNGMLSGFIYINTLRDDVHYLYKVDNISSYELTQRMMNRQSHSDSYKKLKWVYLLPIDKAKIL